MPPLRSAPTPVGRQRGLDHSADEPDDVVQTGLTLDETITLRSHELLDFLDERQQGEAKRVRRQAHANEDSTASLDHYRAWTAMRNATSERDNAEEKHKSIAKNKRDRQNAIKREKRKAKALAKLEDKGAIIGGLKNLSYLGVDGIAEWSVHRRELFLDIIADDNVDDILCCRQAIRKKQAVTEVDDAPTRLEDDEQARD
ncbi:hypothetical protein FMEXI_1652 [Fusarium mexicanum]|uniref:Uncharacterized protein n=1 Tax=Fusarium mexicanum TaxID=751941 RepID=A0A8H5JH37_9HYPO|nr:hypothetical protein FMEXI_1652 [Fusarium mexicanum]